VEPGVLLDGSLLVRLVPFVILLLLPRLTEVIVLQFQCLIQKHIDFVIDTTTVRVGQLANPLQYGYWNRDMNGLCLTLSVFGLSWHIGWQTEHYA
jgi:hypothetical protein